MCKVKYISITLILLIFISTTSISGYGVSATFQTTSGEIQNFSQYEGNLLIVDAVASWCTACEVQFQNLQDVYNSVNNTVKILTLSIDQSDTIPKIIELKKRVSNPPWTFALDYKSEFKKLHEVSVLPTIFLFDEQGSLIKKWESITPASEILNTVNENIEKYNIDTSDIVVAGYSFGGAMVLTAAIYNLEIKRIISIAGGDESVFGRKRLTDENYNNWFEQFLIESEYPDGPIKCDTKSYSKFWLSNLDKYDQVKHAESLKNRDILFLGGWKDKAVVLEEHILPLYRKLEELTSEKLQIKVFDTDHGFGNVREELVEIIEIWIKEKK